MTRSIDILAKLVISIGDDQVTIVADGQYVIINVASQQALDRLTNTFSGPKDGKSSGGFSAQLNKLKSVNDAVKAMKFLIDVRVGGKTYVELGGKGPRITANAVIGKISSFFKR